MKNIQQNRIKFFVIIGYILFTSSFVCSSEHWEIAKITCKHILFAKGIDPFNDAELFPRNFQSGTQGLALGAARLTTRVIIEHGLPAIEKNIKNETIQKRFKEISDLTNLAQCFTFGYRYFIKKTFCDELLKLMGTLLPENKYLPFLMTQSENADESSVEISHSSGSTTEKSAATHVFFYASSLAANIILYKLIGYAADPAIDLVEHLVWPQK